jgi:carbon starvation protein
VLIWGYLIYTGSVSTIWPLFGTANQLLSGIALVIGTSYIINSGKAKYAWVTMIPMAFILVVTFTAGIENITGIYIPQLYQEGKMVTGIISLFLTSVIMVCLAVILWDVVPPWYRAGKVTSDE